MAGMDGDDEDEEGDDDDDAYSPAASRVDAHLRIALVGDIYIMMQCVIVCNEKSSLPPGSLL